MTAGACPLQQWGDEIVCTAPACGLRWDKADERPDCRLGREGASEPQAETATYVQFGDEIFLHTPCDFDPEEMRKVMTDAPDWSRGVEDELYRRGTASALPEGVPRFRAKLSDWIKQSRSFPPPPTDAMLDAGAKAFMEQPIKGDPREAARAIWKAMHDETR